jgi:hypothetical protein
MPCASAVSALPMLPAAIARAAAATNTVFFSMNVSFCFRCRRMIVVGGNFEAK